MACPFIPVGCSPPYVQRAMYPHLHARDCSVTVWYCLGETQYVNFLCQHADFVCWRVLVPFLLLVLPGPSYNVAFFPKIYKAAGYPNILDHMEKQGSELYADPINWLLYQVRY